ncbi:MAG: GNAT family N-acetyltransferase [Candidatus Zixiibacteriota bacterium]|nr:MAG: GNAT family N-acetyltransferase [candidate division Zixibacteria bacterium]
MEIRLIADGEEELCNKFHNRLYNDNRTMHQWRWEFVFNNYDRRPIPYAVVVDNGEIVGTQAFIPIRMIDEDGCYWTAKSEETLVDPDYRGKRLFERMYRLLFNYANEHELAHIWGFTPATRAFERLGFSIPAQTEQIFVPFSNKSIPVMMSKSLHGGKKNLADKLKIAAIRSGCLLAQTASSLKIAYTKRRTIDGLDIRTWHRPDEQTDHLCRRFIRQWGGTTIYRDAEYLQWRLFDNPYVKSVVRALYYRDELLGWVAFTMGDDGMGYLVDLMTAVDDSGYGAEDLIRLLLLEAVIGTRNMGATGIRGWRINNHPFDRLICSVAKGIGFYHIKRGHAVVLYPCQAGAKRGVTGGFDDWFVSRVYTEGVLG